MTDDITKNWLWKPGQSGNPKGRPPKKSALTEVLKMKGEAIVARGNEEITAKDALAQAVWGLILTGEVWLSGRRLEVESVTEWASVVKWLYGHMDTKRDETEDGTVMEVRVVRVDKPYPKHAGIVEVVEPPSTGLAEGWEGGQDDE